MFYRTGMNTQLDCPTAPSFVSTGNRFAGQFVPSIELWYRKLSGGAIAVTNNPKEPAVKNVHTFDDRKRRRAAGIPWLT